MFYRFRKILSGLFATPTYSSDLERFIMSKKPKSVVEMEFLVKEYDMKHRVKYY